MALLFQHYNAVLRKKSSGVKALLPIILTLETIIDR